jgi:Ca2+-binding RTX toxin-like protein
MVRGEVCDGSGGYTLTDDGDPNGLTGNAVSDNLSGLAGNDTILAEDGLVDMILCGPGTTDNLFSGRGSRQLPDRRAGGLRERRLKRDAQQPPK